jgi:DNA-binding SARP family transcriptional activator
VLTFPRRPPIALFDVADERVRIALLGGLTVTVGPLAVADEAWPTRRAAELVALLALADGHRLVRDQVVEALWPHLSPAAGAANLRKAAHFARQALGSEQAVRLAGGRVALFPGRGVDTDIASYERRAGEVLRSADRAAARALAAEYPADLLPDLPYAEWTQEPRERLRARHVAVLRLGGEWERLVAAEPTDEHAHRELMRTALGAGAPHTAIRWYGRLRTHLEGQLGLPPSAESRALYEECVARLPSAPAVVGRQPELARMATALRSPGALVLRGAPGIGKSTLCRELAVLADDGAPTRRSPRSSTSCSAATARCSTGCPRRPAPCWPSSPRWPGRAPRASSPGTW